MLITLLLACGGPSIHVSEELQGKWTHEFVEYSDTKYINFWVDADTSGTWSAILRRSTPVGSSQWVTTCNVTTQPEEEDIAAIAAWNADNKALDPLPKVGRIQCKLGDKESTGVLQLSDIWLLKN